MDHIFLYVVFLLLSCQMQGSRAVTPVFVQKGHDLLLDVIKHDVPEDFIALRWNFNGRRLVTFQPGKGPKVSDIYMGRVSLQNYSVILKNLQETDSGVYMAQLTDDQEEQILTQYNVTVQDPVSPVTLTVDSVFNSSDSCNLTVTCRTQDSNISSTFRCVNQICSDDGGETSKTTTSGAVLHVYIVNHSIICNHSNQVSWTTNKRQTKIQDLCPLHNDFKAQRNHIVVITTTTVVPIIFIIIGAVLCYRQKRKKERMIIDNTVYAVPEVQELNPDQTQNQDQNQNPITSTYAMVDFHTGPGTTNTANNPSLPGTIYAQVNRAAKSNSNTAPQPAPRSKKQ